MRGNAKRVGAIILASVLSVGMLFMADVDRAHAEGTAKVAAEGAKIRSSASTSSDVVASVTKGDKLDVLASTKADDGYTWYKIRVNGTGQGYVRADLVSDVEGSIGTESASSESTESAPKADSEKPADSEDSAPASDTSVSESSVRTARISGDSVTVREGASTKTNKKATATGGIEVSVTGEATDSDGKTWYQVSYDYDDKTVEGFIRSDFLEVLSTADDEAGEGEEEMPEAIAEEPVVQNQDFEVKYETNNEGVEEWFLYDHIRGTKQSINNIYAVMQQSQELSENEGGASTGMKVAVIIMAVIILVLIIALTILLFKVRDSYDDIDDFDRRYNDDRYEDDDEDEEDDEEDDEDDYYESRNRRSKRKVFGGRRKQYDAYEDDDDDYEDEDDDEEDDEDEEVYERPSRRRSSSSPSRKNDSWPARGLIDVDDDMEFEFLDLED